MKPNKARTRAWRRHQKAKAQAKARKIAARRYPGPQPHARQFVWEADDGAKIRGVRDWGDVFALREQSARIADHLKSCSCWMCGNPRRHGGEKTLAEKRADEDAREQVEEAEAD